MPYITLSVEIFNKFRQDLTELEFVKFFKAISVFIFMQMDFLISQIIFTTLLTLPYIFVAGTSFSGSYI